MKMQMDNKAKESRPPCLPPDKTHGVESVHARQEYGGQSDIYPVYPGRSHAQVSSQNYYPVNKKNN